MARHKGLTFYQKKKRLNAKVVTDIVEMIIGSLAAIFLAFVIVFSIGMRTSVIGNSMEPALYNGQEILMNRVVYKLSSPKRNDVVVFLPNGNENSHYYVKRVIGLPGETVEIIDGMVYIDGSDTPLDEEYLSDEARTDTRSFGPYKVPDNCYFMLGDNRPSSADARMWENTYVERDKILAKAEFIYMPLSQVTWLGDGAEY